MSVYYLENDRNLWFDDVQSQQMGGQGSFISSSATATITIRSNNEDHFSNKEILITNTQGESRSFLFTKTLAKGSTGDIVNPTQILFSDKIWVQLNGLTTKLDFAKELKKAIKHANGFNNTISVDINPVANPVLTLTQSVGGKNGNTEIINTVSDTSRLVTTNFTGGEGSCKGGPMLRIGMEVPQQDILPGSIPTEQNNDPGLRVGRSLLFGDHQDISYLEGYVQGKNVKNLTQFFKMNLPLVRANNCQYYKSQKLSGELDHTLSITRDIALGQNDGTRRTLSSRPFNDAFMILYSPVAYITAGKYVLGYPIVTDNTLDFENFNDPDALDSGFAGGHFRDGVIEPLGIRNSFGNPNTSNPNILVQGIKGSFMPYHQEQGDWSDSKGSCGIDDKVEFRQGPYDWFEDAQDLGYSENVFPLVGQVNLDVTNDKFYSLFGYVSDGNYIMTPFIDQDVDEKYFSNKYRQLSQQAAKDLLKDSSKTLSNIGSRFKSSTRGIIIDPKKDSINQLVLGTDSYAFAGLIRS